MRVIVADHPLITHKLTVLRDRTTPTPTFRLVVNELMTLLGYEATRELRVESVHVETSITTTTGVKISHPTPVIVPILRAGLGMLDGMVTLLPTADVGFLGIKRNETTMQPETYADRIAHDLTGRQCFVLDPMLATGGSLAEAIRLLFERGASDVTAICLIGTPEGINRVRETVGDKPVTLLLGALDDGLDEHAHIVPGLGDAGDRLYGSTE